MITRLNHVLVLVLVIGLTSAGLTYREKQELDAQLPECGYQSCPELDPNMINVHLVPHTHNDIGWLKTVDQYYYGAKSNIQIAGVQYILDSVIQQLVHDPTKRFIYVESGFFWRWWMDQNDYSRHQVAQLVKTGQLEFISGGWSMNDEAAVYYNDVIDQMTWGFRFLHDVFGDCAIPRIGWQIDPFGHSSEQASLFAQMGFDGLFLGRVDYQDKELRWNKTNLEMVWRGSRNIGWDGSVFTGILPNMYNPPQGFCFDVLCDDPPIMDNPSLSEYNVDDRVEQFLKSVQEQQTGYRTNNLIMTMGSDFQYQSAITWYKNLDKLIHHVNKRQESGSKINLLYSTPSCYLQSLNQANQTWSVKSDDFFPYASDPHAYWTGYFTSRATLKGFIRTTNNFLQVCKQMDSLGRLGPEIEGDIDVLKRAQGVAQHHDAVSGTSRQYVAYDYAKSLSQGVNECQTVVNAAYQKLIPKQDTLPPVQIFCNLLNISDCNFTTTHTKFALTVYNPIGRDEAIHVRIPVRGSSYSVTGPGGETVESQLVPVASAVIELKERNSDTSNDLVFLTTVPAMGFQTFFIAPTTTKKRTQKSTVRAVTGNDDVVIQNDYLQVVIDGTTGLLKTVIDQKTKLQVPVTQDLAYYQGAAGYNKNFTDRASGAYIFRPNGTAIRIGDTVTVTVVKGSIVEEVQQTFSPWASQVIRLYKNTRNVELEWLVGPIDINDNIGKEVISRFATTVKSNTKFYTDANGREIQERVRNYRPTWELNLTEPIASNYYPVNSRIFIKDDNVQVTVMTDRSQGGASLVDGSLELMVHRRLLYDDAFGVGEPLNETGTDGRGLVVRGKHYLLISTPDKAAALHRDLGQNLLLGPSISFAENQLSFADYSKIYKTEYSGLRTQLPPNVHLLTLEQWKATSLLLRLEHFYESGEDTELSKPATVSLKDLFTPFTITTVTETTLGGNQPLSSSHRFQWSTQETIPAGPGHDISPDLVITLAPMQIRTFIIEVTDQDANNVSASDKIMSYGEWYKQSMAGIEDF